MYRCQRHGASGFTKELAVKVLLPQHAHDPQMQRRLIGEAHLGAAMSHRNLVTVFDLGVDQGRHYVVMERVDGADLRALTQRERPSPAVALYLVTEIAAGLAYLHTFADRDGHALGLVHRDVSPGNVLVSTSGEVKLADFGITKATNLAEQTHAKVVRGKYGYLAPEQLAGGTVSARADQFALGVTLSELVAGRRPFDGDNPGQTMDRIRRGDANLDGVPKDLLPVIRRCLAARPEDRYADMHALTGALWGPRSDRLPTDAADVARWSSPRAFA